MHTTLTEKRFNKVSDYVKKLEGVTQVGQARMLVNKSHTIGNFSGSWSKDQGQQAYSAFSIQLTFPASIVGPTKVFYQY